MKTIKPIALVIPAIMMLTGCATISGILPGKKASDELVISEPAEPAQIQSTFLQGDTLWDFAERTTGSGFNWEKIKVLNGIVDETDIDAGIVLLIPPELALEEFKTQ